jgi:hypothetical protein
MLNSASIDAVDAAVWRGPFVRPLYESYCFAGLPATVQWLLTGAAHPGLPADTLGSFARQYDAVVVLFVDGFGWRFVEPRVERYPALKHFIDRGVVSKLTSMFPSTTSAHVTAIHTGLPPSQSGVYEWFQYEPAIDRIICPLMFSLAGDDARDTLLKVGLAPNDVFPPRTIYSDLKRAGVRSYMFHTHDVVRSAPTQAMGSDATIVSYRTLPEVLMSTAHFLRRIERPVYLIVYYSPIDTISHHHGPKSDYVDAEIDQFLVSLDRLLLQRAAGSRALLIVTADHGQVEVDPRTTLYLNHALPDFERYIATNRHGDWLTPAGAPRDYFLHVRPDVLNEARRAISDLLVDRALVINTEELIEQRFFGADPAPVLLRRLGNLVVLPYKGESVFYYERGRFGNHFYGHHGGLTREEMEVPLMVCEL